MTEKAELDLWAMDEVHFQQHGSRIRMWVPPEEKDPKVAHHPTRKGVGYFGAIRLRDGKFIFRKEADSFNAETTLEFFKMIQRAATDSSAKAVVIIDNARYHHAKLHKEWRQSQTNRIEFDYLPPYSPELNPIERVWKLTKRNCLHNRYFPQLQNVVDAVEAQFAKWSSPNETLRRLCAV
jgi:transposase